MGELRGPARSQFLLRRLARINACHIGIFPSEHCHELMLACAGFRGANSANFAQAMTVALRHSGRLTPILELVAKACGAVRLVECRCQPGLVAGLAHIEDSAQRWQDWKGQHFGAFLPALELREGDGKPISALVLFADEHCIRATHAKIKHDGHRKARSRSYRPKCLERFDVLIRPGVKSVGSAPQLLKLLSRVECREIVFDRPGIERRDLLQAKIGGLRQASLHVPEFPNVHLLKARKRCGTKPTSAIADNITNFIQNGALAPLRVLFQALKIGRFVVAIAKPIETFYSFAPGWIVLPQRNFVGGQKLIRAR